MRSKTTSKVPFVKEFITAIREQLALKRVSLSELARETGMSRAYLHETLKGEHSISFEKAEVIANYLGLSLKMSEKSS